MPFGSKKPMQTLTSSNLHPPRLKLNTSALPCLKSRTFLFKVYLCDRVHVKIPGPASWNPMVEQQIHWGTAFKQQTRPTSSLGIHESDKTLSACSQDTMTSFWFITIKSKNAYIHCCSLSQFIPCQIHFVDTSCIRNEADIPKIGRILWDDHAQKSDDDTPWNHGWSWGWSSPSQPSGKAIGIDENPIVQMWGFPSELRRKPFRRCSSTKNSTASVRLVKD